MTPEDILSRPARVLTPEQRRYYFDNGYVVVYSMYDDTGRWVLSIPEEKLAWADWSGGYVGLWAHQKDAKAPTIEARPASPSAVGRGTDY